MGKGFTAGLEGVAGCEIKGELVCGRGHKADMRMCD